MTSHPFACQSSGPRPSSCRLLSGHEQVLTVHLAAGFDASWALCPPLLRDLLGLHCPPAKGQGWKPGRKAAQRRSDNKLKSHSTMGDVVRFTLRKDRSGCCAGKGPGTPGGDAGGQLLLGVEVAVAWTSEVWWWREAAGSQTCLVVKASRAC